MKLSTEAELQLQRRLRKLAKGFRTQAEKTLKVSRHELRKLAKGFRTQAEKTLKVPRHELRKLAKGFQTRVEKIDKVFQDMNWENLLKVSMPELRKLTNSFKVREQRKQKRYSLNADACDCRRLWLKMLVNAAILILIHQQTVILLDIMANGYFSMFSA